MTPEQALAQARAGQLAPVYLVTGEETLVRSEVAQALREAALRGGIPGLNDDQLEAGETSVGAVLGLTRTMPMMARRRCVLVRNVDKWEGKADDEKRADALEALLAYAAAPAPDAVLVLLAAKLDKRRRFYAQARKGGWVVECDPLPAAALPGWVETRARSLGGRLEPGVAELVADLAGPELGAVADAVTRLCLYAGDRAVTEADVGECLVRLRGSSVWELVDAVGRRDLGAALTLLHEVFDAREAPRFVGLLASSTRKLLKFEAALAAGAPPPEAAQRAGAPPFKSRELAEQVRRTSRRELEKLLAALAEVDLAVKGGSKRPAKAIFEAALITACARSDRRHARSRGDA